MKSRAAIVTLITWRPVATVNPLRIVALDPGRFVHEAVRTHHVLALPIETVPILLTAVWVSIPAILLAGAVKVMATVNWIRWIRSLTVVIALVAYWPFPAIC